MPAKRAAGYRTRNLLTLMEQSEKERIEEWANNASANSNDVYVRELIRLKLR